jgi:sec-independent protein translocase protein TatA
MIRNLFEPMHLLVILIIVMIIFGPGKLPQIGAGLGKSIREFKKALSGEEQVSPTEAKKEAITQDSGTKQS